VSDFDTGIFAGKMCMCTQGKQLVREK